MNTYTFHIGADVRAYARIDVEAGSFEGAKAQLTPDTLARAEYGEINSEYPEQPALVVCVDETGTVHSENADLPPMPWETRHGEQLARDLWDFIENCPDDAPDRQERFFALRDRVRAL